LDTFGWTAKTSFDDLVKEMITEDLKMAQGTLADPEAHRAYKMDGLISILLRLVQRILSKNLHKSPL